MKCDEVKELIMDYIDKEANESIRKDIATHLDTCASCKKLEESLRVKAIEPFRRAEQIKTPEEIWHKLRENIVNKNKRADLIGLLTQWRGYFQIKKPVLIPALTVITVMLFITVLFFGKTHTARNLLNAYLADQVQFVSDLANDDEENYFDLYYAVDLDTSIERYFL